MYKLVKKMKTYTYNMSLKSEEVVKTQDGYITTPFVKFDKSNFSTNRKAINVVKKVEHWLIKNAYLKSLYKKDEYNQFIFSNLLMEKKIQQADKDSAEMYLVENI